MTAEVRPKKTTTKKNTSRLFFSPCVETWLQSSQCSCSVLRLQWKMQPRGGNVREARIFLSFRKMCPRPARPLLPVSSGLGLDQDVSVPQRSSFTHRSTLSFKSPTQISPLSFHLFILKMCWSLDARSSKVQTGEKVDDAVKQKIDGTCHLVTTILRWKLYI